MMDHEMQEARQYCKRRHPSKRAIRFAGLANLAAAQELLDTHDPYHPRTDHYRIEPAGDLSPDTYRIVPFWGGERRPTVATPLRVGDWITVNGEGDVKVERHELFNELYEEWRP